jgi:hypothetical protein
LESQEERGEIDSQVDLPQTGNFGGYKRAADEESDGGQTVVKKGDQSPILLEDNLSRFLLEGSA